MFKKLSFGLCVLAVLMGFLLLPLFAAERVDTFGSPNSSGEYAIEAKSDGELSFPNGYILAKIEEATTSDTLVAADSGTIFLVTAATTVPTFTLPTAADGLVYKFVVAVGDADSTKKVILDPESTDTFVGCVSSSAATTFVAGDRLISAATTSDSITIVGASTKWYCVDRVNAWVDYN